MASRRSSSTRTKSSAKLTLPTVRKPSPAKRAKARTVLAILKDRYPQARCALNFRNPLELLIATVLSAQCTDVRVNMVTPKLFAKYPDAKAYAEADRATLEEIIRPTGFFRNKATAIIGIGQALTERFDGKVPRTLEELTSLPGVGRKTANVVLGNAFDIPGLTVDTHFGRVSRRLGWTASEDPLRIEADVAALFPPDEWTEKNEWTQLSHRLIFHGRTLCHARRPACGVCPVEDLCPSSGDGETDPVIAATLVKEQP